jgi:predicted RNA-binding protein with PUA-like domain
MNYWLVKSEPEAYSWAMLVKDGKTAWTGVRNFTARNNLRAMTPGDSVFFYHSGEGNPAAKEGDWSCVDLAPVKPLAKPVNLSTIKADKVLKEMVLAKQSRLSVSPVTEGQFNRVLELAGTKI